MKTKSVYLQTLVDKVKTGKWCVLINRYVKEVDTYRLSRGESDVVIDVDLKPYTDRVRESVDYLLRIPLAEKRVLSGARGATLQEVELAIDEKINSLRKSVSSDDNKPEDDKYIVYSNWLKQNSETGDIYITGQLVSETEYIKPKYKEKKSKVKTLLKEDISKNLSTEIKRYKVPLVSIEKIKLVEKK
jgi:hypothetical protein